MGDEPERPADYFLLCAFLGAECARKSKSGEATYEEQARELGTSKPNLVKLGNRGTVGAELVIPIAQKLHGGVDLAILRARSWWEMLDVAQKRLLAEWARRRTRTGRRRPSDRAPPTPSAPPPPNGPART